MATKEQKRIQARLEQIKSRASEMAVKAKDKSAANLAEEAAGLGLQLLEEKK